MSTKVLPRCPILRTDLEPIAREVPAPLPTVHTPPALSAAPASPGRGPLVHWAKGVGLLGLGGALTAVSLYLQDDKRSEQATSPATHLAAIQPAHKPTEIRVEKPLTLPAVPIPVSPVTSLPAEAPSVQPQDSPKPLLKPEPGVLDLPATTVKTERVEPTSKPTPSEKVVEPVTRIEPEAETKNTETIQPLNLELKPELKPDGSLGGSETPAQNELPLLNLLPRDRPVQRTNSEAAPGPASQQPSALVGHTGYVSGVAFLPDGKHIVSASEDQTVAVWQLESGRMLAQLKGHTTGVHCLALSADGQSLLTGGGKNEVQEGQLVSNDCTIRHWDLSTGQVLRVLAGHQGPVTSVLFVSPDRVLSASTDRTLRLWDLRTGTELRRFEGHRGSVHQLSLDPSGRTFLSAGGYDRSVRRWDLDSGRELACVTRHLTAVHSALSLKSGRYLFTATGEIDRRQQPPQPVDCAIHLWDVHEEKHVQALTGHTGPVRSLALAKDGFTLLSGSLDGSVRLWNLQTGKEAWHVEVPGVSLHTVALSPDGSTVIAGGSDHRVHVWQVK